MKNDDGDRTTKEDEVPGWGDALVRERGAALVRYAGLLTGDAREAEDLVQEALVRTFARVRGAALREPTAVEGYVRRAVLNAYLDGYRRRQRWAGIRHLVARPDAEPARTAASDDRTDVEVALARLAPRLRAAVVLRYYDDLTVPEVARRLGVSDGAVKRYLHEGVALLGTLLGPVPDDDEAVDLTLVPTRRRTP